MSETVQYTSWGGRLMQSLKGVVAGLVFFIGSFVLIFWNEGRAVRTARGLEEGRKVCLEAPAERPDPAQNGKLVHLSGAAATATELHDPQFGVGLNALKLERRVEMFQWVERQDKKTEKQLGGGEKTVTRYSYQKRWDSAWHDSGAFHDPQTPPNPPFRVTSQSWVAEPVTVGGYRLPRHMVDALQAAEVLAVEGAVTTPAGRFTAGDGAYQSGADPANPQVGDLRVSFRVLKPCDVSLLARLNGGTFEPFVTSQNTTISVIKAGVFSADLLFQEEMTANSILTWILRAVGWMAMAMGLGLIFKPLATLGDVVPLIGGVLQAGIGFFALLISLTLTLFTMGIAWVAYRPVLGVTLLAGAFAVLIITLVRRRPGPARAAASLRTG